jgi:hypothetical protein
MRDLSVPVKKPIIFLWGAVAFIIWFFSSDPSTSVSAVGVLISGGSTLAFWRLRESFVQKITFRTFLLIGGLGALWVESEFWLLEKITGVSVAASPTLVLDLLVTMPWYLLMIALLWKVETRYSYSPGVILLYGGLYDFCADSVLGTVLSGTFSPSVLLLLVISFPVFVCCYSFIVLPPSYLLRAARGTEVQDRRWRKYIYALLPLAGLLLYGIIVILLFSGG